MFICMCRALGPDGEVGRHTRHGCDQEDRPKSMDADVSASHLVCLFMGTVRVGSLARPTGCLEARVGELQKLLTRTLAPKEEVSAALESRD